MNAKKLFSWSVVGGGPAGIAAVGKLIDNGVKAADIAWVDPCFDVGLLGRKWQSVWSNTRVKLFVDFLEAVQSFNYDKCPHKANYTLHSLPPMDTCQLMHIVKPLEWVTQNLREQVESKVDTIENIKRDPTSGYWTLTGASKEAFAAKNIVLATGSVPQQMDCAGVPVMPLDEALQVDVLKSKCGPEDTVGVFGSSHSAIMIVRDLIQEAKVKKVINFYRSELRFAQYTDKGIVYDSTGLKGKTAEWAQQHLVDNPISTDVLERYESTEANIHQHAPRCSRVICAVGFKRLPVCVEGMDPCNIKYDAKTGKVTDGMYGLGIAFPEEGPDAAGNIEAQVGLWKFMRYLNRVMPQWVAEAQK